MLQTLQTFANGHEVSQTNNRPIRYSFHDTPKHVIITIRNMY